ncbi:unnamed protein product [Protopolystoma xenopodis]|uniref:Uncharacterized protein n=1 Tax=Protopolystoma xenopodis TaxID=117903 RepID=A0A3S5C7C1_9PLAT|nr:unnamed protein product [Protopolystoma xenopodis]
MAPASCRRSGHRLRGKSSYRLKVGNRIGRPESDRCRRAGTASGQPTTACIIIPQSRAVLPNLDTPSNISKCRFPQPTAPPSSSPSPSPSPSPLPSPCCNLANTCRSVVIR